MRLSSKCLAASLDGTFESPVAGMEVFMFCKMSTILESPGAVFVIWACVPRESMSSLSMLLQARTQGENLWAHVTSMLVPLVNMIFLSFLRLESHGAIVAAIGRNMVSRVEILHRGQECAESCMLAC